VPGLTIAVHHCGGVVMSRRGASNWPCQHGHRELCHNRNREQARGYGDGTFLHTQLIPTRTSNSNVFGPRGKPDTRPSPSPSPQTKSPRPSDGVRNQNKRRPYAGICGEGCIPKARHLRAWPDHRSSSLRRRGHVAARRQ